MRQVTKIAKTRRATKDILTALQAENLTPAKRSVMLIQLSRRGEDVAQLVHDSRGTKADMIRALLNEGKSVNDVVKELNESGIKVYYSEVHRLSTTEGMVEEPAPVETKRRRSTRKLATA